LIGVKDAGAAVGILTQHQMEDVMSIGSILLTAAALSVFVIFAAVFVWGDFQRQPARHQTSGRKHRAF
jgi:hypothetical protein